MKYSDFDDLPKISPYRYENFLNVYLDPANNQKFFNLIRSINVFQANDASVEDDYYIKPHDTWYNISYRTYNTGDLWWLICTYNQVYNPAKLPEPGTKIKLLKSQYVGLVLHELANQLNR